MEITKINQNLVSAIDQTAASSKGISGGKNVKNNVNQKVEQRNIHNVVEQNQLADSSGNIDEVDNLERVTTAVNQLNKIVQSLDKKLEFFIDDASGRYGVKVIDRDTKEVVRQIPPEEVLALSAKIQEMVGMLLDERS